MFHYGLLFNEEKDTNLVKELLKNKNSISKQLEQKENSRLTFDGNEVVSANSNAKENNVSDLNLIKRKNGWIDQKFSVVNNQEDSVLLSCNCSSCCRESAPENSESGLFVSPLDTAAASSSNISQDVIDTLLTTYAWSDNTITYSFYDDSVFNNYYGNEANVSEVSEAVKTNVREILNLVETFADLEFVEVDESETGTYGQIRYMLSDNPGYAYAYLPFGSRYDLAGDVHLRTSYDHATNTNGFQNDPGRHGYTTLIHETFHALGLEHPHSSDDGDSLDSRKDNMSNTVMTYDFTGNSAGTAMPYDIAALQHVYGAADHNTGDETYVFGTTTDVYTVNGQSPFTTSHRVKQTIWDSAGTDTLDFSGLSLQSGGYLFDLNEGGWLIANAQKVTKNSGETYYKYGTSLAYEMTIENVINSRSNDTIVANAVANTFSGYTVGTRVGNDILRDTDELDTLDLSSYSESNVTQTPAGDNLVIDLGSDGSVTVEDYFAVPEANRLSILLEPDSPEIETIDETTNVAIAEIGKITNLNHNEQTITLQNNYENPVVFAQPLSYNGADPSVVRITDINSANDTISFYLQEAEYKNGWHTNESFSYMVVEAGTWQLEDGTLLEVGTLDTDRVTSSGWENISFNNDFTETPAVLSQVQTNNDNQFVRTRQQDADANGFSVTMEEEEALRYSGHSEETIGWLAIDSGSGEWDGFTYQAGNTGDVVTHNWHELDLDDFDTAPNLLASIATYDGSDASGLRYREIAGANGSTIKIKIEEDKSADGEVRHTTEDVDFFAIGGSGILTAQAYDPLSSTIAQRLAFSEIAEDSLLEDNMAIETDFI
ncbi:conserved hypothetical protein [Hyella patelloides LEGE 07179]|uniref:Peptidase metallopeptidase domain-containing protein n=1 Tax=Hyella patelloides LEGE 07179 TaxID=945734 RepID=A0A563VTV3_9CYAN|nr:M10 family metallopeptidase [Hyella patelloides]VEP14877.1 conserved hypothetical protein [Hyella patelloides LEGE 07179]